MTIVTLSRQMASLGDEIAESLAKRMNWMLINRDTLLKTFFQPIVSKQTYHLLEESARSFLDQDEDGRTYRSLLVDSVRDITRKHDAVLVGFASQVIFAGDPDVIHLRTITPREIRIARVCERYHVSDKDAERIIRTADRKHHRFVRTVFSADVDDPDLYHLVINTAELTVEECVSTVLDLIKLRSDRRLHEEKLAEQMLLRPEQPEITENSNEQLIFKNDSEAELAKILDMYHIDWVYEPRTFPIEWDAEGNVRLAFSPDFYLPRFDTYLELTTMNQKYVTEKNKKARRLRELYPGIQIKIVYKKDFESLVQRLKN